MRLKDNKKSQITIFIIMGIVIALILGTYIYVDRIEKSETIPSESIIEDVPLQFQPLRAFVDSCLIKSAEEALTKIGNSGGYADLAARNINSNPADPTEANAFRFFPQDKNSEVAYWWYFKSNNQCRTNCECSSEMPFLRKNDGSPSIEEEIEKYIDINMKICLNDFESFKSQGYDIIEEGQLKTTATIAENDIPILVEYPITVKKGESEAEIKNFFVRIPLDLHRIYELASELTEREMKYPYLERWTQEQINAFGLVFDNNASIPATAAASFNPGDSPVTWSKSKTKNLLTNNILPYYTSFFQVFNTANYIDRTGSYYERTTLPVASPSGKLYNDMNVNFEYLNWWPIYLEIRGRGVSGDLVGPETSSFPLFEWIGLYRYNSYYDVSYPVRVDIYDSKALNNKGYHFYIGLESNVRSNKPLNCSGAGTPLVVGPTGSMLCDRKHACANVTITAVDAKTGEQIDNVIVSYGTNEQCDAGKTSIKGEKAALNAMLPQCVGTGCSLLLSKQGYFSYPLIYSVRCDNKNCEQDDVLCNNEALILELEPKRTIKATVKKKRMMKSKGWNLNRGAVNLLRDESALITLEKIKEFPFEEDIVTSQIIDRDNPSVELDGLVPGSYSASIQLFYEIPDSYGREEIVFKEKTVCSGGGLFSEEECHTYGPQAFNETFPEGYSQVNFTITKENIDNFDTIIFYVISSPDSSSFDIVDMDDLVMMGKSMEFSKTYRAELEPGFGG